MKRIAKALAALLIAGTISITPATITGAPAYAESASLSQLSSDLAAVTEKARPMVVNISTSRTVKTPRLPFADDPFFKRFFGEQKQQAQQKAISLGSGVIVSADGYIVTCNHVIESAEDIIVRTLDKKEYKAKVVGTDAKTDVAVLKIEEKGLPSIPFGNSDLLKPGEIVLAIGNPYGLSSTTTMGIVSATKRSGIGLTEYEDFIQIDAAINPGNSGGALINVNGELIGINDAIFSTTGGYMGIGFAIPTKMVRSIMDSMLTQGKVVRGYMGIQIQPLNAELVKQFGLKDQNGALVVDVTENGPAEKAGIQRGDVMIEYDNKKIESLPDLKGWVAATPPGKAVPIRLIRDGKTMTVRVVMTEVPGSAPAQTAASAPVATAPSAVDNNLKGVTVRELTNDYLQKQGINRRLKGVVITDISEDSPALGTLERGDIILEVARKLIGSQTEYMQVVSKIPKNQNIVVLIMRGNVSLYVTVESR
ncbi:MAG TPA: DegQ family serine endoprotease [Dissulfurispiraceae bacterium]|nr:DegQ family serine endoprotease [Dissulfurispiraceae bacterium]